MRLSWLEAEKTERGIKFVDPGCGCCGWSPEEKGDKAIEMLEDWIVELQDELISAGNLLRELRATETE